MGGTAAGQATDDPEMGGESDQGAVDPGSQTAPPAPAPAPAPQQASTGSTGGNLALTGGDVTGLAIIGASIAGAGIFLVVGSRRRSEPELA